MKVWYDTEFDEDGRTIELISIGMVAEDGRELYRVVADADWDRIARNDWVMKHVVPQLPPREDPAWRTRAQIRHDVATFLHPYQPFGDMLRGQKFVGLPELWAWYGAYDHVALAQLFGRMVDFPTHVPQWTNDVKQELLRLGNINTPAQQGGLHDALADARHLKVRHQYLIDVELARKGAHRL